MICNRDHLSKAKHMEFITFILQFTRLILPLFLFFLSISKDSASNLFTRFPPRCSCLSLNSALCSAAFICFLSSLLLFHHLPQTACSRLTLLALTALLHAPKNPSKCLPICNFFPSFPLLSVDSVDSKLLPSCHSSFYLMIGLYQNWIGSFCSVLLAVSMLLWIDRHYLRPFLSHQISWVVEAFLLGMKFSPNSC